MLQNQSCVTLFIICVQEFLINIYIYAKIYLQCSKAEIWTPHSEYYNKQNHSVTENFHFHDYIFSET